jgi:hypothetical protein
MRYNLKKPKNAYWFSSANPRTTWTGDAAEVRASRVFNATITPGGYGSQKWQAERAVADREEGYDYPVIRYAEVLLNYAEAVYEKNGNISDGDLDKSLNLVRNRVNRTMPRLSNTLVNANGLDMQTEIRRERNIELFLEGFRLDDLKRWNIAKQELTKPLIGIKWTGTQFQTEWPSPPAPRNSNGFLIVDNAANRKFSDRNYLIPIPTEQIQLNPQLGPNQGW